MMGTVSQKVPSSGSELIQLSLTAFILSKSLLRGMCASNQATVPTERKLYVGEPRSFLCLPPLIGSGALPSWACIQSTEAQALCSTVTPLS